MILITYKVINNIGGMLEASLQCWSSSKRLDAGGGARV